MKKIFNAVLETLFGFVAHIGMQVRAAFAMGIPASDASPRHGPRTPSGLTGWISRPAIRFCGESPGYLTSNGLGSLEIGAATTESEGS